MNAATKIGESQESRAVAGFDSPIDSPTTTRNTERACAGSHMGDCKGAMGVHSPRDYSPENLSPLGGGEWEVGESTQPTPIARKEPPRIACARAAEPRLPILAGSGTDEASRPAESRRERSSANSVSQSSATRPSQSAARDALRNGLPTAAQFRQQCGELSSQGLRDARAGYWMALADATRAAERLAFIERCDAAIAKHRRRERLTRVAFAIAVAAYVALCVGLGVRW